jgi:hypothetical protein
MQNIQQEHLPPPTTKAHPSAQGANTGVKKLHEKTEIHPEMRKPGKALIRDLLMMMMLSLFLRSFFPPRPSRSGE